MKNAVIIKSFPNGLTIFLDSELPFSQLLEEIAMKFSESANFFKDASMVLSFEGRELTEHRLYHGKGQGDGSQFCESLTAVFLPSGGA